MFFIEVKSLAGVNYIRAADVIAVQFSDPKKCSVMMAGGISIACTEAASDIAARIEAAVAGDRGAPTPVISTTEGQTADGDAS